MAVILLTCPSCKANAVAESKNGKPVFCPECGFAHTPPRSAPEVTGWYYARGKERLGPVSTEQLLALSSAGRLDPATRLWPENGASGAGVEVRAVLTLLGHDQGKCSSLPDKVSDRTRQHEVEPKQPPSEPASVPDWLAEVRIPEKSSPPERPRPSTNKPAARPVLNAGRTVDPQSSGAPGGGGIPILFNCPVCQTHLRAAPEQAGAKLNCPKCNQRLQIPQPPINRTILGTLPPETERRHASAPVATLVSSPATPPLAQPAQDGWSYVRDKKQIGPVSFQQLQQLAAAGRLASSDMVHQNGMVKWIAAGSLPGLFPVRASAAPSSVGATVAPLPASFNGMDQNRKLLTRVSAAAIIGLGAVGLGACLLFSLILWQKGSSPDIIANSSSEKPISEAVAFVVCGATLTRPDGAQGDVPEMVGSGFCVSPEGHIITNKHVVQQTWHNMHPTAMKEKVAGFRKQTGMEIEFRVWVFFGKQKYSADILYVSERYDLAILKVERRHRPFFALSSAENLTRGTRVSACGFPVASRELVDTERVLDEWSHKQTFLLVEDYFKPSDFIFDETSGSVSRLPDEQNGLKWIQHNAPISGGNSGGPLLTEDGLVVGINTKGALINEGQGQGIFYALAIPQLRQEIEKYVPGTVWK